MNRLVLIPALAIPLLLAGLVVAMVYGRGSAPVTDFASVSEVRRLKERTAELEEQIELMYDEMRQLKNAAPTSRTASRSDMSEAAPAELESRLDRLEKALASGAAASGSGEIDEEFLAFASPSKEVFRNLLDEVREDEREEERRQRMEAEAESIRKRVEEMAGDLELNGGQIESMVDILVNESTARRDLFSSRMRGGPPMGEEGRSMWEEMGKLREERDTALQNTLSDWQYEEYKKSERERERGWGRRGGGGDRGGDRGGRGGRGGRG